MRASVNLAAVVASLSLAVTGSCKKSEPKPGAGGSAVAGSAATGSATQGSAAGSDSVAAGSGAAVGSGSATGSGLAGTPVEPNAAFAGMTNKGGNCPSFVAGATTTAVVKDNKILLTIAADSPEAISTIQKRTAALLAARAAPHKGSDHNKQGTNGGGSGKCPVSSDLESKAENNAKGVVVTYSIPAGAKTSAELQLPALEARIKAAQALVAAAKSPEPGLGHGGGVGGGKGDDGSNRSGQGDGKGKERDQAGTGSGSAAPSAGSGSGHGMGKGNGHGDGTGGGKGTGGGGGSGTGGGDGKARGK